jgi:TolB-like protein/DNA-binding winged helix-turn-helix (wHTH) protein/Flp pilus assembly protein TadD
MNTTAPAAYLFEGFRLDLARRRLSDPAGNALQLSGRAFDVLVYLVENRARVVGKDEIMRAVWPRVVVEENNLNQAIYNLRKALADSRESPRFILTIAGRGYQFIAETRSETVAEMPPPMPVTVTVPAAAVASSPAISETEPVPPRAPTLDPSPSPPVELHPPAREPAEARPLHTRRWLLLASAAAAGAVGVLWWKRPRTPGTGIPPSLAVLPFRPLLEPDANAAVEFGLTETLINRLGELPGVVVPPLSSVRRYAAPGTDPLQAGRELGVAAVLDGHVQVATDRLRVTARLLDTRDGRALWSGRFNERLDDFFAVQESIADQVVAALAVELSQQQRDRLTRRDTADPEAWQLYLQGRYHSSRRTEESLGQALKFYEAAARRDPSFALPQVGISDVLAVQGVFGMRPPLAVFPRALAAVERAVELDDDLAEAYTSLGHVRLQFERNWREGERLYRLSLSMRPNQGLGRLLLANCLIMQGRNEESLTEGQRAQSVEPADVTFAANYGMLLMLSRRFDAAYELLTSLYATTQDFPLLRHHLARLHVLRGEPGEAIRLLEGFVARAPGSFSNLGRAYARAGRVDDARAEIGRLLALGKEGFGVGYDAALIHAALGERDAALTSLESGLTDYSQPILFMNVEPGFDALREEPRFRAVSARLGLG